MADAENMDDIRREAIAGKAEAQTKLGVCCLKLAETGQETVDNSKEAVSWFIKASRQGSDEATEKLKQCLERQFGVDDSNLADVKWCVKTPRHEKLAREAARKLFRKIQPSKDRHSISKAEFDAAVLDLTTGDLEKKMIKRAGKPDGSNEVTEEAFVNKMMKRLQGQGTITFNSLLQNDVEWEAYYSSTMLEKVTKYPGKSVVWVADNTIEMVGSQGRVWIKSIIPVNQLYMLILIFLYSLISIDAILWFIPILSFYISYCAMVISTLQMFYSRRKLNDVKALAGMLESFSDQFEMDSAESTYTWNSLTPYVSFFVTLLTMLLSFSSADSEWIPCAMLCFISAVITVACFLALSDIYDYLAMFSIALDNVPSVCSLIVRASNVSGILPRVANFLLGNIISVELLPQFYVELGFYSLVYLVVPILFLIMAMRKSWSGTYRVLIPHLVCFFWWRVFALFFQSSTWMGLGVASIGWAILLVALPFLALGIVIYMFYLIVTFFTLSTLLKVFTTLLVIAGVTVLAAWSRVGFSIGRSFNVDKKSVGMNFLLCIIVLATIPLSSFLVSPEDLDRSSVYINWDTYRASCGPEAWQRGSVGEASTICSHFSDAKVNWAGTVKQTRIKLIENQAEKFISSLPEFVANRLRCVYGQEYASDCSVYENIDEQRVCEFNHERGRSCHLKHLNRTTYEISVNMLPDNLEIKLEAPYYFTAIARKLKTGDEIRYRAYLAENIGGIGPVLKLYWLQCTTCENPETVYGGSVLGQTGFTVLVRLKKSLQCAWNFFLAPIMYFK